MIESRFAEKLLILLMFTSIHTSEPDTQLSRSKNHIQIFNLYVIVDVELYLEHKQNVQSIENRIQSIFILVNKIYLPVGIQVQITQIEVWKVNIIDKMTEEYIIPELKMYKQKFVNTSHDCLHAFLGSKLVYRKYGDAVMQSMCSKSLCVGYTVDSLSHRVTDTAYTVSHELAHNFGLKHDTSECKCSNCIMATGIEISSRNLVWSECSKVDFQSFLNNGYPACKPLHKSTQSIKYLEVSNRLSKSKTNQRVSSINISICGNGIVEMGEECDCGKIMECEKCCDVLKCKLLSNAQCGAGSCCDSSTCQLIKAGRLCRASSSVCDIPDLCDGINENCGKDNYAQDGTDCKTDFQEMAYCFEGKCKNPVTQCKFLWGTTANNADISCYTENTISNDIFKNCGVEPDSEENAQVNSVLDWKTKPCNENNFLCGRLWCTHNNEKLMQFGLSKTMSFIMNNQHFCESSRFELDWSGRDIGMVPNGEPCGFKKICLNAECVNLTTVFDENCHCNGNGICDNSKMCHCFEGYLPPNCSQKVQSSSTELSYSKTSQSHLSIENWKNHSTTNSTIFTDLNESKHISKIRSLVVALIMMSTLFFIVFMFILIQTCKSKKVKRYLENNFQNQDSNFIDEISFKEIFLKKEGGIKANDMKSHSQLSENVIENIYQLLPTNTTADMSSGDINLDI